jgi:hypothetical protein
MARKADSSDRIPTNKWTTEELADLYLPDPPWKIPTQSASTEPNWIRQLRVEQVRIGQEIELETARETHSRFITRYYEATAYHIWEIIPLYFALILITGSRWPGEAKKAVCKSQPSHRLFSKSRKKSGWNGSLTLSLDRGDKKRHQTNRI